MASGFELVESKVVDRRLFALVFIVAFMYSRIQALHRWSRQSLVRVGACPGGEAVNRLLAKHGTG